jgi:two-component system, OmpR family, sensor kinase
MSSSPPPEDPPPAGPAPTKRQTGTRLGPLSLRTRLIVAIVALVAVVCGIIGLVTTVALRGFLVDQLDAQLRAAGSRSERAGAEPPPRDDPRGGPQFLLAPGQATGTLGARVVDGRVAEAAVLDPSGTSQPLAAAEVAALAAVPVDGRPHSRDIDDLGDYRVIATRADDGDVLITGLPLAGVQQTTWWLVVVEAIVIGSGLLVAGVAGAAIVRLSLRPLRRVAATASQVAELPLARGEVALSVRVPETDTDARTEVGQVGAALNRLLGHVADALAARHASETRVRQFVADASHELRTPLAAIRGYAELTRRGHEPVPPDVAHALSRVESEGKRMTALVDDLLLLARLDSGRPLQRLPVDLSQLVVHAVSDAHAAGPDHRWTLELPDEAVLVPGDEARLQQVLANLLANARTHTPPQTTVTTTLTPADGCVVVTVADDGPGVPAALQKEVFERFTRADTSRSRAAGSTGLGLAIVAAVVDAHQGKVDVTSRPGRTVFAVTLPAPPLPAPIMN